MQLAPFLGQSLARSVFTEHANPTGLFLTIVKMKEIVVFGVSLFIYGEKHIGQ